MTKINFLLLLFSMINLENSSGRILVIEREHRSQIKDVRNLNRTPVKMLYFEVPRWIETAVNDTRLTHQIGDIWNLLEEYLNFTLVPNRLDPKKYLGQDTFALLLKLVVKQETDVMPIISGIMTDQVEYTLPFYTFNEQFYIRPILKPNEMWIFSVMEYRIWFVIGGFMVLMALGGWLSDRFLFPRISRLSMGDHLFYNFTVLCNQGFQPNGFNNRMKILSIVRWLFVFLFWIFFGALLYTKLVMNIETEPFNNAHELLETTNFKIVSLGKNFLNGPLAWTATHPLYKNRIELVNFAVQPFEMACAADEGTYAIIAVDYTYSVFKGKCQLQQIGDKVSTKRFFGVVRRDFKFKRSIDLGILKLRESGLLSRVLTKWTPVVFDKKPNDEMEGLNMNQFKYVFGLLVVGMISSVIFFFGGIIIFIYQEQKTKKKKEKKKEMKTMEKKVRLYVRVV